MRKKSTIRDVAKAAGVSIATVSFVLNKHPNEVISEKVKQRVWKAAKDLDYHASATAAGLARKRTRNVAIVFFQDESTIANSFYSFVIQGAIQEAIEKEYNLLFSFVDTVYRGYQDLPRIIQERNAEGVLFMRRIHPKMVRDIQGRGIPVVAIDSYPAMKSVDSLQIDSRRGGQLAAEHLFDLGHTRLAMLSAAADRPSIADRVAGFEAAFKARRRKFSPRTHVIECSRLDSVPAYETARRVLQRKHRPTALFCANDEMAAAVLRAAHELGIAVPAELSVVGFDNVPLSYFTSPQLTTIGLVKEQLGRRGMARLLELVEGGNGKVRRETVPVDLVLRASTAQPPG